MNDDYAIRVKHVSKKFKLYHEKRDSFYESLTSYFNRKNKYEILSTLNDVTFDVKPGEVFGIIGKNGGGKSTLLKIISKIYRPDSGSVDANGKIVPLLSLGLGFHPELTAIPNIYQSGILMGYSKNQISQRIGDIIRFAELEKFADTTLKNFSSGMKMRLAFATSILVDPDILLLDEVFAVGDLNFQKKCFEAIMSFKKQGKTIIFVSHNMQEIKNFCDTVMFLKEGKVGTIGNPEDAIAAYVDYLDTIKSQS